MTRSIADLTVSVERSFDADADALFAALVDPAHFGSVERVATNDDREPPNDDRELPDVDREPSSTNREPPSTNREPPSTNRELPSGQTTPGASSRLRPGETYVGDLRVPVMGVANDAYETYFTVERTHGNRLVLAGGGDADVGSFDARVVVAVADVLDGAVVRVDATMDVAGDVAAAGAADVRAGVTRLLERYLSGVECGVARSA